MAVLAYLTTSGWARETARRAAERLEEPDLRDGPEPYEHRVGARRRALSAR